MREALKLALPIIKEWKEKIRILATIGEVEVPPTPDIDAAIVAARAALGSAVSLSDDVGTG